MTDDDSRAPQEPPDGVGLCAKQVPVSVIRITFTQRTREAVKSAESGYQLALDCLHPMQASVERRFLRAHNRSRCDCYGLGKCAAFTCAKAG